MTLIHNAQLLIDGQLTMGFVLVKDDMILQVQPGQPKQELLQANTRLHDAQGDLLLPGVIDTHVHFREPGLTHKATMASESAAAVAGGVTSFIDMPNVMPPTSTLATLEDKWRRAADTSLANYAFYIGATANNADMIINEVDYSRVPGVKVFLGSSTGGMLVDDNKVLHRLFQQVPAVIAVHSEDEDIIRRNMQLARERYGDDVPCACHPDIRSEQACWTSTQRAVALARQLGTRLHLLHLTTARELQLLSPGPVTDKRITAEACVGHLWFSDRDYDRLGTRIKVNPAIKTVADRDALRQAVATGLIDVVATDHAPHCLDEKNRPYLQAPSGMPMLQFSLLAMLELARQGHFALQRVIDTMCHNPARLFRIHDRGFLRQGYKADMVQVRQTPPYELSDADTLSLCRWTPLQGARLHHRVVRTWVNGIEVYPHRPVHRPAQPLHFR